MDLKLSLETSKHCEVSVCDNDFDTTNWEPQSLIIKLWLLLTNCETWIMILRFSDSQSNSDLDRIRNSCDVFYMFAIPVWYRQESKDYRAARRAMKKSFDRIIMGKCQIVTRCPYQSYSICVTNTTMSNCPQKRSQIQNIRRSFNKRFFEDRGITELRPNSK